MRFVMIIMIQHIGFIWQGNPKPISHLAFSLLCVGFLSQRKQTANPTQIVLPLLRFDLSLYLDRFGVLSKDYDIRFQNVVIMNISKKDIEVFLKQLS